MPVRLYLQCFCAWLKGNLEMIGFGLCIVIYITKACPLQNKCHVLWVFSIIILFHLYVSQKNRSFQRPESLVQKFKHSQLFHFMWGKQLLFFCLQKHTIKYLPSFHFCICSTPRSNADLKKCDRKDTNYSPYCNAENFEKF